MECCRLWFKFDVLTDVLVIISWCGIASVMRCALQLLDLLIFEEVYSSHKKILIQWKNRSNTDEAHLSETEQEAVETTTTFKFVRNLGGQRRSVN